MRRQKLCRRRTLLLAKAIAARLLLLAIGNPPRSTVTVTAATAHIAAHVAGVHWLLIHNVIAGRAALWCRAGWPEVLPYPPGIRWACRVAWHVDLRQSWLLLIGIGTAV